MGHVPLLNLPGACIEAQSESPGIPGIPGTSGLLRAIRANSQASNFCNLLSLFGGKMMAYMNYMTTPRGYDNMMSFELGAPVALH